MVFLWFMGCTMGLLRLGRWLQRQQCSSTALRQQQQHLLWGDACAGNGAPWCPWGVDQNMGIWHCLMLADLAHRFITFYTSKEPGSMRSPGSWDTQLLTTIDLAILTHMYFMVELDTSTCRNKTTEWLTGTESECQPKSRWIPAISNLPMKNHRFWIEKPTNHTKNSSNCQVYCLHPHTYPYIHHFCWLNRRNPYQK